MLKKKVVLLLLILSLGVNIFIAGKQFMIDRGYVPTQDEDIIMSEMIVKTINSEDYKNIAQKEKITAIDKSIDKYNGGVFPYNLKISVLTDNQTHRFVCDDEQYSKVVEAATTYSKYSEEETILPLGK